MKITDRDQANSIIQQYAANTVDSDKKAQESVQQKLSPEEKVDLSSAAKDIQKLRQAVDEVPDVREDKVADLKQQIEKGAYHVNGEKVAEKMMGESLLDIFA